MSSQSAFFDWPKITAHHRSSNTPSDFVFNSSDNDILAAIATAEVDPNIQTGQFIRLCSYESLMYSWIFDCYPPSIADLFYFFCIRANLLDPFCQCYCLHRSSTGMHGDSCPVHIVQVQLIVSFIFNFLFYFCSLTLSMLESCSFYAY